MGREPIEAPWKLEGEEVARRLGTDPERGLSPEEAARRLVEDGPNEIGLRPRFPRG